jgi:hypothetical protein
MARLLVGMLRTTRSGWLEEVTQPTPMPPATLIVSLIRQGLRRRRAMVRRPAETLCRLSLCRTTVQSKPRWRRSVKRDIVMFLLLCFGVVTVRAEARLCENESKALVTLKSSWAAIASAAEALPAECFNGYFGEGISDVIVRKSAEDWPGFVAELTKHEAPRDKFFLLYLRCLNSTLNPDDIKAVSKFAKESCPRNLAARCGVISDRARVALADYDDTNSVSNP